jgi:ribosome maturation factor RimP
MAENVAATKIMLYICTDLVQKKRGHRLSPRLLRMAETIEKVYALLEPLLEGTDVFIVNIKVKPVNNIKVYLDADSGLSIDKCTAVNRKLYAQIVVADMFPDGDFSLEVSSPGVDEPLLQQRQYKKNIGRKVMITDNEGKEKTGIMKEVTDEHVILETKGAKVKDAIIISEIPIASIKTTVVQIIF